MRHFVFDPPDGLHLRLDPHLDELSPYIATRDHFYRAAGITLIVPEGFHSDLATIPWPVLWVVGRSGRHQRAAFFHDAAYQLQTTSRVVADALFYELLIVDRVSRLRAAVLYLGVRACGWWYWRSDAPEKLQFQKLVQPKTKE